MPTALGVLALLLGVGRPPGTAPAHRFAPIQQDSATAVIRGRLIDDETGSPIAFGTVHLLRDGESVAAVVTRQTGEFRLVSRWPGAHRLRAEALGYHTAESRELHVERGDSVQVEFRLAVDALALAPLTVVTRGVPAEEREGLAGMRAFFERYARYGDAPFARFMLRDSIATWENRVASTGQMLKWTTPAVRDVDPVTGEVTLRGGCEPAYYLNGTPVQYDMVQPLTPTLLEAVEIYLEPGIPAEYARGAPCGVVAYWSRQSPVPDSPNGLAVRVLGIVTVLVGLGYLLLHMGGWGR